jgi:hypothetical protein
VRRSTTHRLQISFFGLVQQPSPCILGIHPDVIDIEINEDEDEDENIKSSLEVVDVWERVGNFEET